MLRIGEGKYILTSISWALYVSHYVRIRQIERDIHVRGGCSINVKDDGFILNAGEIMTFQVLQEF